MGSYVRNPPESRHTPGSVPGCVIFVKLWQFDLTDRIQIRTVMDKLGSVTDQARDGVKVSTLFADTRETVRVEQWEAGAEVSVQTNGGAELLVLEGQFEESGDDLRQYSWLRVPNGYNLKANVGSAGAKVWIKFGHLK